MIQLIIVVQSIFSGRGLPEPDAVSDRIPDSELPRCQSCGGLLRPHVVWFGESLDPEVLDAADDHLGKCDLCLVVGTSSIVYPAAMFAPQVKPLETYFLRVISQILLKVARRGVPVAEFNLECTPATHSFAKNGFFFEGPCGELLPSALAS